jgi:glycerophosphoryl diester phosphodiesterase
LIFEYKPSVVGHRGSGAGQPDGYQENSLEAFLAAAVSGVPWVELDARRSSDGELMLWHDPVTPDGELILAQTAEKLAAKGIVRLDEVLALLPANVGVDVDVKTVIEDATDPEPHRTHALIAARCDVTRERGVSSSRHSTPRWLST